MRRTHLITTAALVAACAVPATAGASYIQEGSYESQTQASQDLRSPDARDAAATAAGQSGGYVYSSDPASSQARASGHAPAGTQVAQDLRSPDARDAGREPTSTPVPEPVVAVREVPQPGFDWGDAGIGAAGILAMVSIAAGLTLLLGTRRRRRGVQTAH
ncbi:MAG TPA: hypothetical protein VJT68_07530 [Thermoleophilaceae bacterium]|nr:hypothetical protein [Thermoleophilaceae bacterium]